jgi:hypothetical protein
VTTHDCDDGMRTCGACCGSGEGRNEGSVCGVCRGRGEVLCLDCLPEHEETDDGSQDGDDR